MRTYEVDFLMTDPHAASLRLERALKKLTMQETFTLAGLEKTTIRYRAFKEPRILKSIVNSLSLDRYR